jgi:hypothetical protein
MDMNPPQYDAQQAWQQQQMMPPGAPTGGGGWLTWQRMLMGVGAVTLIILAGILVARIMAALIFVGVLVLAFYVWRFFARET